MPWPQQDGVLALPALRRAPSVRPLRRDATLALPARRRGGLVHVEGRVRRPLVARRARTGSGRDRGTGGTGGTGPGHLVSAAPSTPFRGIPPARNALELRRLEASEEAWGVLSSTTAGGAREILGAARVVVLEAPTFVRPTYLVSLRRVSPGAGRVGELRELARRDLFALRDEEPVFAALVTFLWGRS